MLPYIAYMDPMGYTLPFQDISGRKFKAFVKPRP
jgi:hypothetical protein